MSMNGVDGGPVAFIKGVPFPADVKFREILVTGPPGSGKTSLIRKLGGWPEEGYLDLQSPQWWRSRVLTFRPREVHFGFPFEGRAESLAVFDIEWLENPSPLDLERIRIPPPKRWALGADWRRRFVFDFLLPPAERLYSVRRDREYAGTHPVDRNISLAQVEWQLAAYEGLALHFHRSGLRVHFRRSFEGMPLRVRDF